MATVHEVCRMMAADTTMSAEATLFTGVAEHRAAGFTCKVRASHDSSHDSPLLSVRLAT